MSDKIQNTNDLLNFLVTQAESRKDWFGFTQQKMTGIQLVHQIAANHANTMIYPYIHQTPVMPRNESILKYVILAP